MSENGYSHEMESHTNEEDEGASSSDLNFGFAFNDCNFSDRLLRIIMGNEGGDGLEPTGSMNCSTVVRVKTLHISSLLLGAKSPYFLKLFSNGMRESEQREVTLRINASEEAALMELLYFIYHNTLSTTAAPGFVGLVEVLMIADKFEVASCVKHCSKLLLKMPMTQESALLCLEFPSSVLTAKAVQPLINAAKRYLVLRYKDLTMCQEEVMSLTPAGIETILSSNDLQVDLEDDIYDFVLKWVRSQFPKPEERRKALEANIARLIRFPYMTWGGLTKVLECNDFDQNAASKLFLEALVFKAAPLYQQRILTLASKESACLNRQFVERVYRFQPVKVVEFELPRQQCVVYLDLKRDECQSLLPSSPVTSQEFYLGEQAFCLSANCQMDQMNQQTSFGQSFGQSFGHCFGLFLHMLKGHDSLDVEFEFAARWMPTKEFVSRFKGNYVFTAGNMWGSINLFAMPWEKFLSEQSVYFVNDVLH